MPDNTVSVQFIADTSQMSGAMGKLNDELKGAGTQTVNWTAIQKQNAQAAEWMAQGNYKTAASFKPATAAMREASIATKEIGVSASGAGEFISRFVGRLVGVGAAFEAIRIVGEAIKYVVTESMDLESAEVRFKSLAGNTAAASTAFEGLKQSADDSQTSVVVLAKAADTVLEAGVPMTAIPATMTRLGQEAKIAGVEVQSVADALLRTSRGEVGPRDIMTATRLAGDETGLLQAKYKDISVTIPLIAKEMERTQRATERTRQDSDRIAERKTQDSNLAITRGQHDTDLKLSAQSAFGEAHGGADIFKAFQTGGSVSSLAGMQGGGQGAIAAVMTQLREGVAQISKEQGVDAMSLVRSGVIGNEEVLAAGGRAREARETTAARGREDKDTGESRGRADAGTAESRANQDARTELEERKERERKELVESVRKELLGSDDMPSIAGVDAVTLSERAAPSVTRQRNYDAYLNTARGKADTGAYQLQKGAQNVGSMDEAGRKGYQSDAQGQAEGIQADSNWLRKLFGMAPGKAQELGMSEESAKILIQQAALTNSHLQIIAEAFSGT